VLAVAGTVAAAIEAARAHRPDVIVMDHHLPDGRGSTAAARIRSELPETRIVMLTGTEDPAALAEALAAGCVGYFEKTSAFDALPAAIRPAAPGRALVSRQHLVHLHVTPPPPGPSRPRLTRPPHDVLLLVARALPTG